MDTEMAEPLVPPSQPRELQQEGGTAFGRSSWWAWGEDCRRRRWKSQAFNENQDTLGKRFWQSSTKAARRMRNMNRLRWRSGNDWYAPGRGNSHFWVTQSVVLLPMAASFPQTTVCIYAIHLNQLYAETILTAAKRQKDTPKMFVQDESSACKVIVGWPCQHDHLISEGVIDS